MSDPSFFAPVRCRDAKIVHLKGMRKPSLSFGGIGEHEFRMTYIQVAYDNRYLIVEHRQAKLPWQLMIKSTNPAMVAGLVEHLIDTYVPATRVSNAKKRLSEFWPKVNAYDDALDADDA